MEVEEIDPYKTRLCESVNGKHCALDRTHCYWAHGNKDLELGPMPSNLSLYKTEWCNYRLRGKRCPFGARCWYANSRAEILWDTKCKLFEAIGTCYFDAVGEKCVLRH